MGYMGENTERAREIAMSLDIPMERFDKGDIRLLRNGRKTQFEAIFSKAIWRMYSKEESLTLEGYLMAKKIHDTAHALAGSGVTSRLDPDVIAAQMGKRSKKKPEGLHESIMEMAADMRNWQAAAGDMWPALEKVVVYGWTVKDAAKLVKRRTGFVSSSIRHTLEVMG